MKTMISAIVYVMFPPEAAKTPSNQWQSGVVAAIRRSKKWGLIATKDEWVITSSVGSFLLNNKGFASGLMCNLSTWNKTYKAEFLNIVKAIDKNPILKEIEQPIEY